MSWQKQNKSRLEVDCKSVTVVGYEATCSDCEWRHREIVRIENVGAQANSWNGYVYSNRGLQGRVLGAMRLHRRMAHTEIEQRYVGFDIPEWHWRDAIEGVA